MSRDEPRPTDHLTEDDLAALIEAERGGPQVVRDPGLLAAALARPQASAFGESAYLTLTEQAAAPLHSVVTSHPLVDGNNRLSLAAALLALTLNRVRLDATADELFALTMAVASGEVRDVPAIAAQLLNLDPHELPPGPRAHGRWRLRAVRRCCAQRAGERRARSARSPGGQVPYSRGALGPERPSSHPRPR